MSDPLGTYLHDHLAGAEYAIQTLQMMRDQNSGKPLGAFAGKLLAEVEADRDTLRNIAEMVGAGSGTVKELASWLAQRASRVKLDADHDLGKLEALEFLELGIHGKWAMWRALESIGDSRLKDVDFKQLETRAEAQRGMVEERRLEIAQVALQPKAA